MVPRDWHKAWSQRMVISHINFLSYRYRYKYTMKVTTDTATASQLYSQAQS